MNANKIAAFNLLEEGEEASEVSNEIQDSDFDDDDDDAAIDRMENIEMPSDDIDASASLHENVSKGGDRDDHSEMSKHSSNTGGGSGVHTEYSIYKKLQNKFLQYKVIKKIIKYYALTKAATRRNSFYQSFQHWRKKQAELRRSQLLRHYEAKVQEYEAERFTVYDKEIKQNEM